MSVGQSESLCFYQSKFRGKHLISPGTGSGSGKNISAALEPELLINCPITLIQIISG